jgi:ribosomal protein L7Ae-like RNA K-turn-binding protein
VSYGLSRSKTFKDGKVESVLISEDIGVDTIKHIMDIADKSSSNVFIVRKNNEIGEMFSKTFKMGAILRYA